MKNWYEWLSLSIDGIGSKTGDFSFKTDCSQTSMLFSDLLLKGIWAFLSVKAWDGDIKSFVSTEMSFFTGDIRMSVAEGAGFMLEFDAVPSSEHVGFTLLTGKLLAKDAGPGSKVVRATLLGCVPSQSLASWENNWIACAAAWFGVRFVTCSKYELY